MRQATSLPSRADSAPGLVVTIRVEADRSPAGDRAAGDAPDRGRRAGAATSAFAPTSRSPLASGLAHRAAKVARRGAACGDIVAMRWPINRIARVMRQQKKSHAFAPSRRLVPAGGVCLRFAGVGASLLMVASRNRPEGGLGTPFGLGVLMLLLLSSEVGHQDLAALIARQPVVDRTQKAAFASPFGTIHEAKFSVAAIGDSIPVPLDFKLIGFDPNDPGVTGSIRERFLGEEAFSASLYAGRMGDRSRKGDYGVAGNGDRLIVLKGDRLKSAPPAAVIPDQKQQGPSLTQQQPGEPLSLDPPIEVA